MFAVIRHPDVAALGICPAGAIEHQRAHGWVRVSEYRAEPADFHLPDFADDIADLDGLATTPAIEDKPEPPAAKATTTKESKA